MLTYLVDFAYILQLCGFITRDVLYLRGFLVLAQTTVSFYAWQNGVPAIAGWNVVLACVNAFMASRILLERRAVALPEELKSLYQRHFSALTPAEFVRWWDQGDREVVKNGRLARTGEQPEWLYFLLNGKVRVARGNAEVTELPSGYFVAEMSLLTGQPANADVDAIGTVEVMRWDTGVLQGMRQRNPTLWTKIQSVIGHDLVEKIRLQEAEPFRSDPYSEDAMKTYLAAASGILLLCSVVTPAQTGSTKAFTGVRLFDGTDRAVIDNATMIVQNGRVMAAGPAASVPIPDGADRVSLAGKTVIPGLINSHGHVNDAARDLRVYAAYGITTVFSLGDEQPPVFAARASQDVPTLDRARVYVSGPVLAPSTPEEARTQVAGAEKLRVDFVKIRVDDNLGTTPKMPPAVYRAVIDEAHRRNLRVASHLFYLDDAKGLVDAGVDLVAHSVRDTDVDAAFIASLRAKGICVCPTLMREVSTFIYESTPDFFSDPLFLAHADKAWVTQLRQPDQQAAVRASPSAQRYKVALEVASRNVKRLFDAGVPIAMGTDTGPTGRFQGYFELMELELMVKAGLTPRQAILAATRDAARCMHVDEQLGTLQAGRWADFVVLNADPLADISNIRQIDSVWIAGNRVRVN